MCTKTLQNHGEQSSGHRLPEGVATIVETMMHEKNRQTHNTIDKPRTSKEFDKSSAGRPNKTKQNQTEPNGTRNPTKPVDRQIQQKVTARSNETN